MRYWDAYRATTTIGKTADYVIALRPCHCDVFVMALTAQQFGCFILSHVNEPHGFTKGLIFKVGNRPILEFRQVSYDGFSILP